jgi:hypothetical protein
MQQDYQSHQDFVVLVPIIQFQVQFRWRLAYHVLLGIIKIWMVKKHANSVNREHIQTKMDPHSASHVLLESIVLMAAFRLLEMDCVLQEPIRHRDLANLCLAYTVMQEHTMCCWAQ